MTVATPIVRGASSASRMFNEITDKRCEKRLHHGPELTACRHSRIAEKTISANTPSHQHGTVVAKAPVRNTFFSLEPMHQMCDTNQRAARAAAIQDLETSIESRCPNDPNGVLHSVLSDKRFINSKGLSHMGYDCKSIAKTEFFRAVIRKYKGSSEASVKIPMMSHYAYDLKKNSYAFLEEQFGCTERDVRVARLYAKTLGPGTSYHKPKIEVFRFTVSRYCGIHTYTMREDVTNASRNASTDARHQREAIHYPNCRFELYTEWCKKTHVEAVGKSSYRGFMESFAVRSASTCEDSVIINTDAQFVVFEDGYVPLICTLAGKPQRIGAMKRKMAWVRLFLGVGYPGQHCDVQSSCSAHCITGALSCSEPEFDTSTNLTQPWGTEHCPECDQIPQ